MKELLTEDGLRYIIERVLDNAADAKKEYEEKKDAFMTENCSPIMRYLIP